MQVFPINAIILLQKQTTQKNVCRLVGRSVVISYKGETLYFLSERTYTNMYMDMF